MPPSKPAPRLGRRLRASCAPAARRCIVICNEHRDRAPLRPNTPAEPDVRGGVAHRLERRLYKLYRVRIPAPLRFEVFVIFDMLGESFHPKARLRAAAAWWKTLAGDNGHFVRLRVRRIVGDAINA